MKYIDKILNNAKKIKGLNSDSELSLFLGNSRGSVNNYRTGRSSPDDYACFVLAEILNIEEKVLIANLKSEYEKDEFRKEFWNEKVKEYGYFTLPLAFCSILFTSLLYILC